MVIRLTPNGLSRALLRLGDLGVEQVRRHRPAGDHPERAGIGERGDEVALRNPAHRPAQHRDLAAEEVGAALHQAGEAVVADAESLPLDGEGSRVGWRRS